MSYGALTLRYSTKVNHHNALKLFTLIIVSSMVTCTMHLLLTPSSDNRLT